MNIVWILATWVAVAAYTSLVLWAACAINREPKQ